jgi:hypothetical protein
MIYLNLNIRNPWSNRFENVWNNSKPITKNKWWSIQILKTDNWFRFEFQYTVMQDHAGVGVEFGLLGWEFHIGVHDNRHWNYTDKCWEEYGQSDGLF